MKMKDRPFLPFYDLSFFPSIPVIITSNLADFKYVITFLKSSLNRKQSLRIGQKCPKWTKITVFYMPEKKEIIITKTKIIHFWNQNQKNILYCEYEVNSIKRKNDPFFVFISLLYFLIFKIINAELFCSKLSFQKHLICQK